MYHSYQIKAHGCVSVAKESCVVYKCVTYIKRHGGMSAAKKVVWLASVSFTETANSPFLIPHISITTGPISIKFTYFMLPIYIRTWLYIPSLKEIGPVVCKIWVSENCSIFFTFFFFAPFYKNNVEPKKDTLLMIDFFEILHTYKAFVAYLSLNVGDV